MSNIFYMNLRVYYLNFNQKTKAPKWRLCFILWRWGIGVSSHQYFRSLRSENTVWLLPGLARPSQDSGHGSVFQFPHASDADHSLIPTKRKATLSGGAFCGDGGN